WIESVFVCAFNFHISHYILNYVIISKQKDSKPKEEARTGSAYADALSLPALNGGVSRAQRGCEMKVLRPYQQDAVKECWDALKKDDAPVLLMASVGAGKSLMLASILITMQKAGKRALCLVNNAELVRNNCATFIEQGGDASIYCAALGEKDDHSSVVFGTPQSVLNAINKNEPLSHIHFNIIVVDEAHNINFHNDRSCFMRILRIKHE